MSEIYQLSRDCNELIEMLKKARKPGDVNPHVVVAALEKLHQRIIVLETMVLGRATNIGGVTTIAPPTTLHPKATVTIDDDA
jgi:UDP-3-O-[3-hydroxymyristoyl] glucosamine N-acyltransferase